MTILGATVQAARGGIRGRFSRAWLLPARSIALALLGVLLAASAASAGQAAWESHLPAHITLVGCGPAGPDSAIGHFRFPVIGIDPNPIPNSYVELDFARCPGFTVAADQQDPRLRVLCGGRKVCSRTDATGYVSFTIMGTGTAAPPDSPSFVWVYADGVLLGTINVAVLERDGLGGLTLADLAYWTADYFRGDHPARSNLNGDPFVDLNDLAIWANAYFSGADAFSPGAYCP